MEHGFFYKAHCEGKSPSSKRLWGAVGFATVQLCILAATILCLSKTGELSEALKGLLDFDLVTSAALLGLSTIAGAFGGGRKLSVGTTEKEEDEE